MRGFRVFLLVFGLCVVVSAIAAPYVWRGVKRLKQPIASEFKRIDDDASTFAADHEQLDCAPEAFRRLDACDGIWCQAQTPIFTQQCLKRARTSPTLCDQMPDSLVGAALWPAKQCREIQADPEVCRRILLEVMKACGRRQPGR